jgi:ribonuclease HI
MKKIVIHTDGGCHGNPGPGGWAATLAYGQHVREISGGEPATTNNRMEMQAAIKALEALKEPCEVEVFTDSSYLKDGITSWLVGWKKKGWRTKSKQPVKNEDLWRALDAAVSRHKVEWKWLKGHAGHAGNERCDQLANEEIAKLKQTRSADQLKAALDQFIAVRDANAARENTPTLPLPLA